ncbi:MAG: hypothetical protein JOY58_03365 [Solirubrobacterales bacterium]|nr:hypothetical protein [Solirubrobacterales bacterium]
MKAGLLSVALATLAVAGCGGSGPLSATQLRSSATHVCTQANQHSDHIATPASASGGLSFLQSGIAVLRPELGSLRTLKAPTQLSQLYAVSLTTFSRELSDLERTAHGLASGSDPVTAMKTLQARLGPLETREDRAWRQLQIPACLDR